MNVQLITCYEVYHCAYATDLFNVFSVVEVFDNWNWNARII